MNKPFQQGHLDGLCGVYALVNAVHLLCGLTHEQAQALFLACLSTLDQRGSLARHCVAGLSIHDMTLILKRVICNGYPIVRSKPFHRQPHVDEHLFLQAITEFLEHPHTVVLTSIGGLHDHWTLFSRITPHTIQLYDSGGLNYLLTRSCSCGSGNNSSSSSIKTDKPKRHQLLPTHTYFLQRRT